jgi:hypothetical protein
MTVTRLPGESARMRPARRGGDEQSEKRGARRSSSAAREDACAAAPVGFRRRSACKADSVVQIEHQAVQQAGARARTGRTKALHQPISYLFATAPALAESAIHGGIRRASGRLRA